MILTEFINHAEELWRDVPNTNLEASNFGRLRNIVTKHFVGEIVYLDELGDILAGRIPVDPASDSVVWTTSPGWYFKERSRKPQAEDELLAA